MHAKHEIDTEKITALSMLGKENSQSASSQIGMEALMSVASKILSFPPNNNNKIKIPVPLSSLREDLPLSSSTRDEITAGAKQLKEGHIFLPFATVGIPQKEN